MKSQIGMIAGFLVGCALDAFVLWPLGGTASLIYPPFIGLFIGRAIVLWAQTK